MVQERGRRFKFMFKFDDEFCGREMVAIAQRWREIREGPTFESQPFYRLVIETTLWKALRDSLEHQYGSYMGALAQMIHGLAIEPVDELESWQILHLVKMPVGN
jgi:hypothetical protein